MTELLRDVFGNRGAKVFLVHRQTAADGHQQRHGMAHVVESLGEEADVLGKTELAVLQAALDQRCGQQIGTIGAGFMLQRFKEGHGCVLLRGRER